MVSGIRRSRKTIAFVLAAFLVSPAAFAAKKTAPPGHRAPEAVAKPEGQVTPKGVVVPLPQGFSLWDLSRVYGIPVEQIIEANKAKNVNVNRLKVGMEILIPGATEVKRLGKRGKKAPPPCFKAPVTLYRVQTQESATVSLCYCNGRPNPDGLDQVSRLARYLPKNKVKKLNPRLLEMLQAVADKYPRRRIEIVSGFRQKRQPKSESRHTIGYALDFRVDGVRNVALRDFVRSFNDAGVGYYPNSVFVHMDVREPGKRAFWCDYSRPGEPALYAPMGLSPAAVAMLRSERTGAPREAFEAETPASREDPTLALNLRPGAGDKTDPGAMLEAAKRFARAAAAELDQARRSAEAGPGTSPAPAAADAPDTRSPSPGPAASANPTPDPASAADHPS